MKFNFVYFFIVREYGRSQILTLFEEKCIIRWFAHPRERDLVYCPKEEIFRDFSELNLVHLARFTEAYSDPLKHLRWSFFAKIRLKAVNYFCQNFVSGLIYFMFTCLGFVFPVKIKDQLSRPTKEYGQIWHIYCLFLTG